MLWLLACTSTVEPDDSLPVETETEVPADDTEPTETGSAYAEPAVCDVQVAPGSVPGLQRWPYLQLGTTDSMTVMFGSSQDAKVAEVGWGRVDTEHTLAASSNAIAGKRPLKLWSATLTDLEPGTEYCYQVSVDGAVLAAGLRFRTAPGRTDAPVKFIVIGDFGAGTQDQLMVRDQMLAHIEGVDLLITTGDNAYNTGRWEEVDEFVFEINRDILHRVVTFPTTGNHDYATERAAPYLANFMLPENAWRVSDNERYYRADWGPLSILALDTEKPIRDITEEATDDQGDWLLHQLSQDDLRPWVLPVFHKPGVEGHETRGPDIHVLAHFIPLFEAYGVRLVFTGHNHHYERFKPLMNNAEDVTPGGVTYVVTGGGGRGLYPQGEEPRRAVGVKEHHFMLGEADGCFIRMTAISKTGEELDHFGLNRCD